jgi:hypothetical protein
MSTTTILPTPTLAEFRAGTSADGRATYHKHLHASNADITAWTGPAERDGRLVFGWWWALHRGQTLIACGWSPGTHSANRDSDVARAMAQIAAGHPAQGLAS